jgi:hypothetical protein
VRSTETIGLSFCFVIDLDEHLQIQSIQIIATEVLPAIFLPSEKSFFQAEAFSVFAASFHNMLKSKRQGR